MRVTNNNYSDNLLSHLQRITRRQVSLQDQASTGQRVQSAADDPMAASEVLKLRDESAVSVQYEKNIQHHTEFAQATHSVMKSLKTVLDRAQDIAVQVDGLDSAEDLKSFAIEIDQLLQHAVQVGNTTHRGEYLLSGTKTATAPFNAVVDSEGKITSVTFGGNTNVTESEIARGAEISSRVPGANESSGERGLLADSRVGADLFGHLIALRDNLLSGDTDAVASTARPNLAKDEDNLFYHIGGNASLQARLETALNSTRQEQLDLENGISKRADIDLAETLVRLNQTQTNYQAALQSAGSVMSLTLLDFLR